MQQQHRASAHRSPYLQQPRNQMVLPAQLQQQGAVGAMGAQVLPAQLQQQDKGLHTPLTIEAETLRDHQAVLMQQQLRARHFEQQQRQAAVEQQQQLQRQHRLLTQQQQQQHQHQALMASSGQPDVFADRVSLPDMGPAAQLQSLPALLQQQAAMLQQQGHAQAAAGALDLQVDALQRPAVAPQQTVAMLTPVDRLRALRQSLGSGAAAAAAQRQDHMDASQHQERQGGQASPPSSLLRHLQQRLFGARGNEGIQILPHSSRHWEDCVLAQMGSSCHPLSLSALAHSDPL